MIQLSYPCMTTEKNIALTIRTFVGKVMSLLFNMQWDPYGSASQSRARSGLGQEKMGERGKGRW